MRYFSAFTGVGGFDLAMPLDWECVGHSEIDKYANMVLRYRFKGVRNYGDVEKIDWGRLPALICSSGELPARIYRSLENVKGLTGQEAGYSSSSPVRLKKKATIFHLGKRCGSSIKQWGMGLCEGAP